MVVGGRPWLSERTGKCNPDACSERQEGGEGASASTRKQASVREDAYARRHHSRPLCTPTLLSSSPHTHTLHCRKASMVATTTEQVRGHVNACTSTF